VGKSARNSAIATVVAFGSDWSLAPKRSTSTHIRRPTRRFTRKIKDRGTLEVRELGNFVVLSRGIIAEAERDRIAETAVVMTVVGARVV
jgi:hypothetical protein